MILGVWFSVCNLNLSHYNQIQPHKTFTPLFSGSEGGRVIRIILPNFFWTNFKTFFWPKIFQTNILVNFLWPKQALPRMSVPRICPGSGNIFAKYQGFDLSHDMLVTPCSRSWHPRVCWVCIPRISGSKYLGEAGAGVNLLLQDTTPIFPSSKLRRF